jgi:hypothetical protein
MVHALLDAASLAASREPSEASRWLGPIARLLEGLSEGMAGDAGEAAAPLLDALGEALDVEIARWEQRARDDGDARAVLRAFLGLRELLWEFGVRRSDAGKGRPEPRPRSAAPAGKRRKQPRVQRIPVQG